MKKIALIGRYGLGEYALVDDEDYQFLLGFKWFLDPNGYPAHTRSRWPLNPERVYMHRVIMNSPHGSIVDHMNRNKQDNRKTNLRFVDKSLNMHNRGCQKNSRSGHKGVYWYKAYGKWEADITIRGEHIKLGYFADLNDAIKARRTAELKYEVLPCKA